MKIREIFEEKKQQAPFLIFLAFLIFFTIARMYRLLQIQGPPLTPGGGAGKGGYTLHHLYYGVALLIISGWISINYKEPKLYPITAILYGAGLGLFFDEIGYMLTHFKNYWDGITYTIVLTIILILFNIIFFKEFWDSVGDNLHKYAKKNKLEKGPLSLIGVANTFEVVNKILPTTRQITAGFTGLILIGAGVLILEYPDLITYWVAAAFILSGAAYIIRAYKSK